VLRIGASPMNGQRHERECDLLRTRKSGREKRKIEEGRRGCELSRILLGRIHRGRKDTVKLSEEGTFEEFYEKGENRPDQTQRRRWWRYSTQEGPPSAAYVLYVTYINTL
jgi:hypothetical protein